MCERHKHASPRSTCADHRTIFAQFFRNRGAATSHSGLFTISRAARASVPSTLNVSLGPLPYLSSSCKPMVLRHLELRSVRSVRIDKPAVLYVHDLG